MIPDFFKIWGTNGGTSQPSDSQYLQGFDFLGSAPPTVELFNWLFQNGDQKLLNLFSASRQWQSSKAYALGDVVLSVSTNSYKYMECTTAGTSGTLEPTWPAAGSTAADGTVIWTVRDMRTVADGSITTAKLADNAATDVKIGNRTVNQALAGPGNTGTLTQLLSWMAGRIKAITGATNWYDAPVKSIAELEAGKAPKLNLSTTGSTVIGVGTLAGGWDSVPNSCMNIVLSAANEIHLSFKLPDGTKRTIKLPFNATLDTIIAKLESPAFTGTPTAPTAAAGASTKQIANTEFVQGAVSGIEGTRVWESGEYIPIVNTPTIVTHGISGLNLLYARGEVLLKCVTAEGGYAVGDYAIGWSSTSNASGNGAQIIPVPLLTDTTIQYNTGDYTSATTNGIIMASKNSGAHFKATLANWRYVFRIFY